MPPVYSPTTVSVYGSSSVSHLPEELLLYIVEEALPEDRRRRVESVVLYSSVCRSWREIFLSTKSLWSALEVTLPHDIGPQLVQIVQRSDPSPLDISIHISPVTPTVAQPPSIVAFCDSVFSDAHRLRKLHIRFLDSVTSTTCHQILGWLKKCRPLNMITLDLQRLMDENEFDTSDKKLLEVEGNVLAQVLPKLKLLRMRGIIWSNWPPLAYHNLDVLEIEWDSGRDHEEAWKDLANCCRLQELHLHFRSNRQSAASHPITTFPMLKKLILHSPAVEACVTGAAMFQYFRYPKLETLHVWCRKGGDRHFRDVILYQHRTYSYLGSLRMDVEHPETIDRARFPALHELVISPDVTTVSQRVLRRLTQWATGSWPRQRVLDLRGISQICPAEVLLSVRQVLLHNPQQSKITLQLHPSAKESSPSDWDWLVENTELTCKV
jgi:hypothetical protein